MPLSFSSDEAVRLAAGNAISDLIRQRGSNILTWSEIGRGFNFQGSRIHFASKAVGIFKPKELQDGAALSIKEVRPSRPGRSAPYNDRELADGVIAYRLEKSGRDNKYLEEALRRSLPLIYFRGVADSEYEVVYPVIVQAIDRSKGEAIIVIGDETELSRNLVAHVAQPIERGYSFGVRKTRLHQRAFRQRVLLAYGLRCGLSDLPVTQLLEAAHILPDAANGEASVRNGIAMSTLHHAAYEQHLLGIDANGIIHVSEYVQQTRDGPLLDHGLQRLDGRALRMPAFEAHRPDRDFLNARFKEFLARWA